MEIPLLSIATGSSQYDYSLSSRFGNESRLSFNLKMDQIIAFTVASHEIKCKLNQELSSPFYAFQLSLVVI